MACSSSWPLRRPRAAAALPPPRATWARRRRRWPRAWPGSRLQLGVKLFHRTTRQVSLTPDGERLYRRCERVLAEVEDLQAEAAGTRAGPSGTLPHRHGHHLRPAGGDAAAGAAAAPAPAAAAGRAAAGFLCRPGARRAGPGHPHRRAAGLARWWRGASTGSSWSCCASPVVPGRAWHAAAAGGPGAAPRSWASVSLPAGGCGRGSCGEGRRTLELHPQPRTQVNDGEGMVAAAAHGLGLTQIPDYMAAEELARGALVEVMSAFRPAPMPISAVMPSMRLDAAARAGGAGGVAGPARAAAGLSQV